MDAGLRGYDTFRGTAWLDESRIYLWRLPVVEEHTAPDQDFSKTVGPHVIDVRTTIATLLESTGFLAMIDEDERGREDAVPECRTALDGRTLACHSNSSEYQRDPGCHSVLKARRTFTIDLRELRLIQVFSTEPECADSWYLSLSTTYIVGLETRVDDYAVAGRRLFIQATGYSGSEATPVVETDAQGPLLHPVGWTRN